MAVKLWSPDGDCHIGLTSGHTMIVPADKAGIDVPARFRKEAIARGCIPVGMAPDEPEETSGFDRRRTIKEAIKKMLDSDEDGLFTGDGKPVISKLSARTGFTVDRSEANAAWDEMQKEEGDGPEVIATEGKPAAGLTEAQKAQLARNAAMKQQAANKPKPGK
jgi:hypothetical protein